MFHIAALRHGACDAAFVPPSLAVPPGKGVVACGLDVPIEHFQMEMFWLVLLLVVWVMLCELL